MHFRNLFILLLLLILTNCSIAEQQKKYTPVRFEIIQETANDFIPEKCLYSFIDKTVFASQIENNEIHIFQDGKKINTIGGMGFEQINFNNLSDIALAPDGGLLALDSFEKKIKKFDTDGKFITSLDLEDFSEPTLFTIATDETFYIYDSDRNEIRTFTRINEYDSFSFGRFQLTEPTNLQLSGNSLIVNERNLEKTLIFNTFGQIEQNLDGYCQIEHDQKYSLMSYYILNENSGEKFAFSINKWHFFSQQDGYIILASKDKIVVGKFIYDVQ